MREQHPAIINRGVGRTQSHAPIFFSLGVHSVFGDRTSTLSGLIGCRQTFGCPPMTPNFLLVSPAPGSGGKLYAEQENRQYQNAVADLGSREGTMPPRRLSEHGALRHRSRSPGCDRATKTSSRPLHRQCRPGTARRFAGRVHGWLRRTDSGHSDFCDQDLPGR